MASNRSNRRRGSSGPAGAGRPREKNRPHYGPIRPRRTLASAKRRQRLPRGPAVHGPKRREEIADWTITLQVSASEYQALQRRANAAGRKLSPWLRELWTANVGQWETALELPPLNLDAPRLTIGRRFRYQPAPGNVADRSVNVHVPEALALRLDRVAAAQEPPRFLSGFLRHLLQSYLRERASLDPPTPT